ncbi:LysR family transcriptional regulator [Pseudomonas aeruginosa]|uniref:LysR family transcriptional regulator n=1 Tax=Pseudomonas aeruginosa TaxID=287 RepID=UPI0002C64A41|nr:LysR family transcriptional regulator [Pseudomonas aeruginosa]AID85262.1 LysR family transcriptional regulator [Pseudomonas aeruginosa VRFPA04]AGI81320.1 transcriptional regulator [Pseudomonas aeruginosa B136-33]ASA29152.1 LysR family transcriptional regulator [Pseudomonas aeruginosa]ASD03540.1 LysR family transcriptional regulator [Pseudomonas aeruginosa]EIU1296903.1 LysR family transcriptional regulator [Pseudomonas aeruginosa]
MKIDDIDAFVAVIRNASLSQAAESLGLTQSAITRRVQSLEESLGVALLDRNTKPLKPTASGLRVYEQCRRVLREVDGLRELVAGDATPSGVLRLGVPQSIGEVVLLDALRRLADEYPELRAQVGTGWGSHLLARLENAELDAAVVLFPPSKVFPEELGATPLGRIELCVVVARDSAIQARRLLDCYHHGWVLNPDGCGFRAGLQRALADQGLGLQLNLETFGSELQLGLVAAGRGLGLVPAPALARSRYRDQLQVLQLEDFQPLIQLWLVRPRLLGNLETPARLFGRAVAEGLDMQAG